MRLAPPPQVTQAMRLGLPVVATPLGLEGTYGIDEVDCLEGSSPDLFADKVAQVSRARRCASMHRHGACNRRCSRISIGGLIHAASGLLQRSTVQLTHCGVLLSARHLAHV